MDAPAPLFALDIPVIETERLILREPRLSDMDAMVAFYAGEERTRFIGGSIDAFQVWGRLAGQIGHWALRGYGMWMVEERATGATVGRIGLIYPETWPEPELGWHVFDGFEGRGYAYEAASAARDTAAAQFGLTGLISLIDPENTRSQALARRLGARVEREMEFMGHPCEVWRHPGKAAA